MSTGKLKGWQTGPAHVAMMVWSQLDSGPAKPGYFQIFEDRDGVAARGIDSSEPAHSGLRLFEALAIVFGVFLVVTAPLG